MAPRTRVAPVIPRAGAGTPAAAMPTSTAPRARVGGIAGGLAGGLSNLGPRGYLYLLVLIEVGIIAGLRHAFRDHHGG